MFQLQNIYAFLRDIIKCKKKNAKQNMKALLSVVQNRGLIKSEIVAFSDNVQCFILINKKKYNKKTKNKIQLLYVILCGSFVQPEHQLPASVDRVVKCLEMSQVSTSKHSLSSPVCFNFPFFPMRLTFSSFSSSLLYCLVLLFFKDQGFHFDRISVIKFP